MAKATRQRPTKRTSASRSNSARTGTRNAALRAAAGTASGKVTKKTLNVGSAPYDELIRMVREASLLSSTASLLGWDQETMMPSGGVEHRSQQLAQLARMSHELATDARIGRLLRECESDASITGKPTSEKAVNVREIRRDYDRRTKLPAALVEEEARLASIGQHTWAEARSNDDFASFKPILEKILKLLREKAKCFGWAKGGEAWDALADDYEPGCVARDVEAVFTPLRERLQVLLDDILSSKRPIKSAFAERALEIDVQKRFCRYVAESIGFDFSRGRLDVSTHPFCSGTHCNDVRLTSRYKETDADDAMGSTLHECGHGMYEQGLLFKHVGTPMGQAVSLGIHESQSRMWENQVGRSEAFARWLQPKLPEFFGSAVRGIGVKELYQSLNVVKPDFIRTQSDEATYNMHIMIRFDLERAMLKGDLSVGELPGAWNAKYKEYLGLTVPNNRLGCLQDVHWSMTAMGYFPTYTLGNLYSAQFFEAARVAMPDLETQIQHGEFAALRTWLNEHIHQHGRRYLPADLCKKVTGKPLSADPLMRHLEAKFRPLYGI